MRQADRPPVTLLVTDLDNTLYDWVYIWHRSFKAMLDELLRIARVPREQLLREIREVHQRRGTSEYSYLIQELGCLRRDPEEDLLETYDDAIHAYRSARKEALETYADVIPTLESIKSTGTSIVAYTESLAFYSIQRMRRLGLDGLIDVLYSPRDHDFPRGVSVEDLRMFEDEHYELASTEHRHTPEGHTKPEPEVLGQIVDDLGDSAELTAYVGDSLMKDVAMAQDVGVRDVHAEYGTAQHRDEYELLRQVSHWTEMDVNREKEIMSRPHVRPTYVLETSFAELLDLFRFRSSA